METKGKKLYTILFSMMFMLLSVAAFLLAGNKGSAASDENDDELYMDYLYGEVSSGVDRILNVDISLDDRTLQENAINANGSKAKIQSEDTGVTAQSNDSLFMVYNVTSKLNVREEPDKEAKTIGALYADCGGRVLERKNGWAKIRSGNLVGWASDEYLAFGDDAKAIASEVGTTLGTVLVNGLTVRKESTKKASSYGILSQGDVVEVYGMADNGYLAIAYEGYDGYVSGEYVKLTFIIDEGETNEEIAAREKAEREAAEAAKRESEARKAQLDAERVAVSSTYTDLQMLAAIIYTEAGNQPYDGQVAVGAVVLNRVKSPAYPNSVAGVLYASGQFSPVRSGRFAKCLDKGSYEKCMKAAQDAMNGVNPIGIACHFHRKGSRTEGIVIGDHIFY